MLTYIAKSKKIRQTFFTQFCKDKRGTNKFIKLFEFSKIT